jgi:hypothetical protein
MLTVPEMVAHLATMTNRDDAGRHFTERYPDALIRELEANGLVAVTRPVHRPTGIPYDESHWTLELTPTGLELVERFPEYHPADAETA